MACKDCDKELTRRELLDRSVKIGAGAGALAIGLPGGGAFAKDPLTIHCLCPTWCREAEINVFQKEASIAVQRACWTSHLSTLTKMATGGTKIWDVVQAHHAFMLPMMRRGLLKELDVAKIPNAKSLFPAFAKMEHGRLDGKLYGIPYVWTYDSVVYNADHIASVDSWGVLFDDKYKGRVALRDDPQNAIQLTALHMGHTDPSVLSSEDLQEIKKFLISKKQNFRKFWTGYAEAITLLRSGEVWALSGWRPMWWQLAKDGLNIKYAVLKEKGIGAIGYYVVSKDTKAMDSAYEFLNWTLDVHWGAAVGRDQGYNATSARALEGLDDNLRKQLDYNRLDEVLNNVYFLDYPLNLNEWVQVWSEVKSA